MNAERAAAVRTQYPARPGRRVIVVTDLASLRGPTRGTVELPLRLYWSGPACACRKPMPPAQMYFISSSARCRVWHLGM